MKRKRLIAVFILLSLIITNGMTVFAQILDTKNHWAKDSIDYLKSKSIISGYPDGTFRPDDTITNAEFFRIINDLMGFKDKADINFIDVPLDAWYYEEIQKGVEASYIDKEDFIYPNNKITREEVAEILGKVFHLDKEPNEALFTDVNLINENARGYIGALRKNGFIIGYPDGSFGPNNEITRAEVVTMLHNITGEIINTAVTINKDIKSNTIVISPEVILENMTIDGDLYITEGTNNGTTTLENVNVLGTIYVWGGSLSIIDSDINVIQVENRIVSGEVSLQNSYVGYVKLTEGLSIKIEKDTEIDGVLVENETTITMDRGSKINLLEIKSENVLIEGKGNVKRLRTYERVMVNKTRIPKNSKEEIKNGEIVKGDKDNDGWYYDEPINPPVDPKPNPDPDPSLDDVVINESGSLTLSNRTIEGNLIINGGGEITLRNVEVKGKIIVNDVSENSLILDNVNINEIEVNDTNGARIYVTDANRNEEGEEYSTINKININNEENSLLVLAGDLSGTTVNINRPSNLKIAEKTSIAEINMATNEAIITSDPEVEVSSSIGSLRGDIPENLADVQNLIKENKILINNLINALNSIPASAHENLEDYLYRGEQVREILEDLLGVEKLGVDYVGYESFVKTRTANSLRGYLQSRTFTTLNQVESAFQDAKVWNRVFNEGMKYAAYQGYMDKELNYSWPVVDPSNIHIDSDITNTFLQFANGYNEDNRDPNITVTILSEYILGSGGYLEVNEDEQKVVLKRLNTTGRQVSISIFVEIVDKITNKSSTTNFIVRIEPSDTLMDINLSRESGSSPNVYIDNKNRFINIYDSMTIYDILNGLKSDNTNDNIYVIDQLGERITDTSRIPRNSMSIVVEREGKYAYYTLSVDPVLDTMNANVVMGVNGRNIVIYPNCTIEEVIYSIKTNQDDYEISITDTQDNELVGSTKVTGDMILWVKADRIPFLFNLVIYIGEIELEIITNEELFRIFKNDRRIRTSDNVMVNTFLESIGSKNEGDILNVVDSNKNIVPGDEYVKNTMQLEIYRDGNKTYYHISTRPILKKVDNENSAIRHIDNGGRITIYPGKTVVEVLQSIESIFNYPLIIEGLNGRVVNDVEIVTEHMLLYVNVNGEFSGYEIIVYLEESPGGNIDSGLDDVDNGNKPVQTEFNDLDLEKLTEIESDYEKVTFDEEDDIEDEYNSDYYPSLLAD